MRPYRVYPVGHTDLSWIKPWATNLIHDDKANELWIDCATLDHDWMLRRRVFDNIEKVVFYDFFHAHYDGSVLPSTQMMAVADQFPCVWYTNNLIPPDIKGIETRTFDFLWNRTKSLYLDKRAGWKSCGPSAYVRSPLSWAKRTHKFLTLIKTSPWPRDMLWNVVKDRTDGFSSNYQAGKILGNQRVNSNRLHTGENVPPDIGYFDCSYISIQTESQILGNNSIIFTEKTYDHLVQGRIVVNFGPKNFYKTMQDQGWRLMNGIDYSWDSIDDDHQRAETWIDSVEKLISLSLDDIHDLFVDNRDNLLHNYDMLESKPYDRID